jgi:hypothetical protein
VTLQTKMTRKLKTCRFGSAHGFGPVFLDKMLRLIKKKAWLVQALQMSEPAVVDWLDSFIGPGELLFLVSHLFAVPDLVLWVGLEKSK